MKNKKIKKILGGTKMKKLENVENTVNSIKNLWGFTSDYNLIFYYMDVNFLYIYSRITKKGSLYFFESE